ncbi:MAG: glycosyltransferase family 2 protein [Gallionella sp.]|nr:glycosyltransferase family 2 protein [Gallionella sp.]
MQADNCAVKPLLTIAIPTYNRANFLDLCLKRIGEEVDSLSADQCKLVKLYVSNNASTDNTTEIISRYKLKAAGEFEVVNNPENIGGERNVAQCYTAATTPYVWVLGDDDLVLPNKLCRVLDSLIRQDIDILYVNGYSYSDDYLDEPSRGKGNSGIEVSSSALEFVRRTHVMLTFITALVVRTGVKVELVSEVVKGSNLPQLGWILPLVRDGKKFVILRDRVYAAKIGNSGGYGAINVFGRNFSNIANAIFKDQPKLARAIQNGTIVTWFPTYIMSCRQGETGYVPENMSVDLKRVFQGNWRYYVFLAPLMVLPIVFARLYFLLIRVMRLLFRAFLI